MSDEPTKPSKAGTVRVGMTGRGGAGEMWARALRGCDGVELRLLSTTPEDLLNEMADEDLNAVVLVSPSRDLATTIKRAILARKHVLVVPGVTDSRQLILLDELARRRERVLLFDACGLADDSMDVARRITRGDHPMRRPRLLRALRVCDADSFETSALRTLSRLLAIAGEQPAQVSAIAPRFADDEDDVNLLLVHTSLLFPSGLTASLDISTLEPEARDELTVVCNGRTLVLDALSQRAPLRVLTAVRQNDAGKVAEHFGARAEHQASASASNAERVAAAFVDAIQSREPLCNAREFATSALVFETARTSLARGGEFTALPANHPLVATSRPSLQLIKGGGQGTDVTAVPRLRLLQGGRRAEPVAPPPRSA